MRNTSDRRGFLRNLAGLPLIGGGITLVGNPTAAAVPVTPKLLNAYETWLFYERRWLRHERYGLDADGDDGWDKEWGFFLRRAIKDEYQEYGGDLLRPCNPGGAFHTGAPSASSRAAVILSAAGCPLT